MLRQAIRNRKVGMPLSKIPLTIVDPTLILDEDAKWKKLYQELFIKQK